MKKITIVLIAVLSVAAMAAQKPCGEVFSNVGIKTTLGIDGSRCVLSKVKEKDRGMTTKIIVSQDNSVIALDMDMWVMNDGVKDTRRIRLKCEDVGAGQRFECEQEVNTHGETKKNTDITSSKTLWKFFNLAQVSTVDLRYLFGGPAPWKMQY